MTVKLAVIDCAKIVGPIEQVENSEAFKEFAKELGDAMKEIGFVYFINHDVGASVVKNVLEKSRKFFELSRDTKQKYRKLNAVENFHGYLALQDENLDELKNTDAKFDYKEAFDFSGIDSMDVAKYPAEVPGFKKAMDDYKQPFGELTKKILRSFALYLNLDDHDFFINKHTAIQNSTIKTQTVLRTNYYMSHGSGFEVSDDMMRVSEHNDWGTITYLIQDETGGLEAKLLNGDWIPVPPIQGSIVLNAGLMLEMWSGGHFPATNHRVRLGKETASKLRQSIAYFIQPDGDCNCVPVIREKDGWSPAYPKVENETAYEYFQNRVRGSLAY